MKKFFLLSTILIFTCSYGQSDYSKNALKLCSVLQSNNFGTDSDARKAEKLGIDASELIKSTCN